MRLLLLGSMMLLRTIFLILSSSERGRTAAARVAGNR